MDYRTFNKGARTDPACGEEGGGSMAKTKISRATAIKVAPRRATGTHSTRPVPMAAVSERSWVMDIRNWVDGSAEPELWVEHSIYRVPGFLKELNRKAYKPQVVSFGPYHHGDPVVRPMEQHKLRALFHFLERAGKPLKDFVSGMKEIVQKLQDSYQDLDKKWRIDRDRFLQLMIVDGCFMLEVMRLDAGLVKDYSSNDPIFGKHGMLYNLPDIRRDMLMVENQLPLLVLQKLANELDDDINRLVLNFFGFKETDVDDLGLHPIDLYRKSLIQLVKPSQSPGPGSGPGPGIIRSALVKVGICKPSAESCLPSPFQYSESGQDGNRDGIIRSALELDEAGIRFKKSDTKSLQDITFHGNVLCLPMIDVDDTTEFLFLNLMAFERLHVGAGNEVTSYVFFMDAIIDSAQDVSLLRSKGIIKNDVGSDKALANIFNTLSKEAVGGFDPGSNLNEVNQKLNDYCQKKRNRWRANLIRTYFRSPWSLISLLAAIILLALTFSQTLYTILAYYYR